MTEFDYFYYRVGVFLGEKYYALAKEMIRIDGTVHGFNQLCRKYQKPIEDIEQIKAIDKMLYQYFDLHEVLCGWIGYDYLEELKKKAEKYENGIATKYCSNCGTQVDVQEQRKPTVNEYRNKSDSLFDYKRFAKEAKEYLLQGDE